MICKTQVHSSVMISDANIFYASEQLALSNVILAINRFYFHFFSANQYVQLRMEIETFFTSCWERFDRSQFLLKIQLVTPCLLLRNDLSSKVWKWCLVKTSGCCSDNNEDSQSDKKRSVSFFHTLLSSQRMSDGCAKPRCCGHQHFGMW